MALTELDPRTGDIAPVEISFPNGERVAIGSWAAIQRETVRWLATNRILRASVLGGQPGKLLVNSTPYHSDGRRFPDVVKVNGWYTPMGADGRDVVNRSVRIVENVGQDPTRFQVRFVARASQR